MIIADGKIRNIAHQTQCQPNGLYGDYIARYTVRPLRWGHLHVC